jgi:geranylgeranyl pyrophosphate synthase
MHCTQLQVLLMSRACNSSGHARGGALPPPFALACQRRLAEITEMIHTASLFHDDVIDKADTRRGAPSANGAFGNKLAILAGDFLLARASVGLARLRSLETVELLSTVIEHLVKGEVRHRHCIYHYILLGDVIM